MKTFLLQFSSLFVFLLVSCAVCSQVPQAMSYQSVIRDGDFNVVSNQAVGVLIQIAQGSPDGTIVFTEEISTTTNDYGLISVQIGASEDLSVVDWGAGPLQHRVKRAPLR